MIDVIDWIFITAKYYIHTVYCPSLYTANPTIDLIGGVGPPERSFRRPITQGNRWNSRTLPRFREIPGAAFANDVEERELQLSESGL